MEQLDYAPKKGHLTQSERANIELLLKEKAKPAEIARRIGRCKSVISREIKRNSVVQMDTHLRAQKRTSRTPIWHNQKVDGYGLSFDQRNKRCDW